MSIVDERVLEYLEVHESDSPKKIQQEAGIPYTDGYVAQRCQKLAENDFIHPLGRGVYRLKERGQKYLDGEFDARSLDEREQEKATL